MVCGCRGFLLMGSSLLFFLFSVLGNLIFRFCDLRVHILILPFLFLVLRGLERARRFMIMIKVCFS